MASNLTGPEPSPVQPRASSIDPVVDSNGKYQSVHRQARFLLAGPAHGEPIPRRPLVDVNSHAISLGQVERDGNGLVRSVTLVREGVPQIPFRCVAKQRDADVVEAVARAPKEFARRHPVGGSRGATKSLTIDFGA